MINATANLRLCWPFQLFKQLLVESISGLSPIFDGWRMSGWQAAYVMMLAPDYGSLKGLNPRSRYARSRSQRMTGDVSRVAGPSLPGSLPVLQ